MEAKAHEGKHTDSVQLWVRKEGGQWQEGAPGVLLLHIFNMPAPAQPSDVTLAILQW